MAIMGASRKSVLSALVGMTISFISSLTASAIGWSVPRQPTRLGPMRTCI
jgi:hypothetical protein